MNSEQDLTAVPAGPPWSLDVLADLQAGVYPPEVETEFRARIVGDADAQATLAALGSVVDSLSLLPPLRMPERYATRLDSAIEAESAARSRSTASRSQSAGPTAPPPPVQRPFLRSVPPQDTAGPNPERWAANPSFGPPAGPPGAPADNVVSFDAARRRRRGVIGGFAVAAAVAAVATVTLVGLNRQEPGTPSSPNPGGGNGAAPAIALQIDPNNLKDAYAQLQHKAIGSVDPIQYASCLSANGISGPSVVGASDVTYQGRAVWAIAVKESATSAEIFVVEKTCGPSGAQLIFSKAVPQ